MRASVNMHKAPAYRLGALTLAATVAAILAGLAFEILGGYAPCQLCLMERYAYYFAIPTLFLALIAAASGHRRTAVALFALVGLAFLANAGLGTYHAGAEWGFWPGPTTCSGPLLPLDSPGTLLKRLETAHVVRCDQASWRLFGLSFAGWNAFISASLWITSWAAARAMSASATRW